MEEEGRVIGIYLPFFSEMVGCFHFNSGISELKILPYDVYYVA